MLTYLASFGAGILIGIIYVLMGVRSPAPPVIALLGLLGILVGENYFPILKSKLTKKESISSESRLPASNKGQKNEYVRR